MPSLPSAQFRKTFPRLTERVAVTSHGHVIGEWTPAFEEAPAPQEIARANPSVDPVGSDVVAERDALRLEVEYLNSRLAGAPR